MLMDNDTIVTLYREAVDHGDAKEVIKSMAKTNGVTPGEIRQILNDAGEFVPRQKPGPKPKAAVINKTCEESVPKITEAIAEAITPTEEKPEEAAGPQKLPLPDAVKICLMRGLDDLDAEIKRKSEELRILEAQYSTAVKYIETI